MVVRGTRKAPRISGARCRSRGLDCYDVSMLDRADILMAKAQESLTGAESELANGRYNNSANRAYYACYQAAVAALLHEGMQPAGDRWTHEVVPGLFDGVLINRR